jgi:outer membrane immunogenic protein
MTKRALLASVFAFSTVVTPAFADWTGLYVGGHVGGTWGDVDLTSVTNGSLWFDMSPGEQFNFSPDGVLGGAQLGYNHQFTNWLIGVEVTGSGMDFDETQLSTFGLATDDVVTVESEWLATAALRLGFLWSPQSLIYLKGGYAAGDIQVTAVDTVGANQGALATDETHHGWLGGVGFEHMISSDVSVGVEYNYIDLGSDSHSSPGPIVNDLESQRHAVTARLNWHLWTP